MPNLLPHPFALRVSRPDLSYTHARTRTRTRTALLQFCTIALSTVLSAVASSHASHELRKGVGAPPSCASHHLRQSCHGVAAAPPSTATPHAPKEVLRHPLNATGRRRNVEEALPNGGEQRGKAAVPAQAGLVLVAELSEEGRSISLREMRREGGGGGRGERKREGGRGEEG